MGLFCSRKMGCPLEMLHRKRWGGGVARFKGWNNEMMHGTNVTEHGYAPPITLDDLSDFRNVARDAAVVTYRPEYFNGPFMDDGGRLRRITLYAAGVVVNGVVLSFKHVIEFDPPCGSVIDRDAGVTDRESLLDEIVRSLGLQAEPLRGGIEEGPASGAILSAPL